LWGLLAREKEEQARRRSRERGGVARRRVGKSMEEARSNTLREEATQAGVVRAFFLFDWVARWCGRLKAIERVIDILD
jgi:hypothetical protein